MKNPVIDFCPGKWACFRGILLVGFVAIWLGAAQAQRTLPPDLDQQIERGMADWEIPGLAIAVVKEGEIVYAKGFGVKKRGSADPVNEHTLFGIASVSKNITAAALAILVDEGKITWDTPIVEVIPWFALSDPWVTSQVTVRDALTHRVGIGRMIGNRLQFMSGHSRDELIRQLRYMDFQEPFRSSFVYSNMLYSVAGQVIEYASGQTWDEFLKLRLFEPIGMQSNTSITALDTARNAAWPHQYIEGEVLPIQRRNWDNAGPAGGINASVTDVAKWMMMQLGEPGVYKGKRLVSAEQMREIHKPQNVLPSATPYGPQASYGLGWNILDHEGKRVLSHGGATDGFNTAAYLVPELELGIVVVGNSFNQLGDALAYTIIDANLGVSGNDWFDRYLSGYQRTFARAKALRQEIHDARIMDTNPTLPLEQYVGRYASDAYDSVEVKLGENGLELHFWGQEGLVADLTHWHYDTYRAEWRNPAQREEFAFFTLGKSGKPEALHFEFVLRPILLQVGAYPSNYTRTVQFDRVTENTDGL